MTFQDVPSEVLDKIFLLLPNSAVRECIFVCKSWNITATRIFYTTVTLTRKNVRKFISTDQPVNYWVRQLKFDIDYPQLFKFTTEQFKVLINQVPKLRILDLAGLSNKSVVEPLLEVLYEDDTLDCIEEIKVDHELSSQARELYFRTVYKYKDTMTCLHLNYLRYTIHGGYLLFLPEFKQLTFLSISNDLLNGDRYMLISSVLDLCPKLIRFGLQTKRHFPDASKVGLLKRMKEDNLNKQQHVYNVKLKELEFELHDFHEGYMQYVIYYTRLNRFYLNMLETDIYEWLVDKEDQMSSFASYLSTIDNVTIQAQSQATKSRQRMSTEERIERNWVFLNKVIGKRKLDCHLYLSMKGYDDSQKFKMKINNNQTIELEYQVKPEYPTNNLISLFQFGRHHNGASIINSIEIGDAIRYTLNDILQVLQCAIHKCPQLKLMVIHRAKLCYRLQSIPFPYNIQFDQQLIPAGQAKSSSNSSSHSIGLNHVTIQGATISSELIHILTDCLPNLKVLKLKECEPIDWLGLDLEGIQELKYLEIDIFVSQPRILISLFLCSAQHHYQYESNDQAPFILTTNEIDHTQREDTFYVTIKCNKIEKIVIHTSVCASELIVPVVQH